MDRDKAISRILELAVNHEMKSILLGFVGMKVDDHTEAAIRHGIFNFLQTTCEELGWPVECLKDIRAFRCEKDSTLIHMAMDRGFRASCGCTWRE